MTVEQGVQLIQLLTDLNGRVDQLILHTGYLTGAAAVMIVCGAIGLFLAGVVVGERIWK